MIERSDAKWRAAAITFMKTKQALDAATTKAAAARDKLITLAGDQSTRGCGVIADRLRRAGAVDYTAVPELLDVNLNLYRKPDTFYFKVQPE